MLVNEYLIIKISWIVYLRLESSVRMNPIRLYDILNIIN